MSSITNNPLFSAGAIGLVGGAIMEGARVLDRYTQYLPSQQNNVLILSASATLVALVLAKSCLGRRQEAVDSKPIEEEYRTNDLSKRVIVVGRSRAGKSNFLEWFFKGPRTCPRRSLFRGTEHATASENMAGKTTWITIDTPGLFEQTITGKQIKRDNQVILEEIKQNDARTIDAVIYTIPNTILTDDINSLLSVYEVMPKSAKRFVLFTGMESLQPEEIETFKTNKLNKLLSNTDFPKELRKEFEDCKVLLSGALDKDETVDDPEAATRKLTTICKLMKDARETLVNELIVSPERRQECLDDLAKPFPHSEEAIENCIQKFISPDEAGIANNNN